MLKDTVGFSSYCELAGIIGDAKIPRMATVKQLFPREQYTEDSLIHELYRQLQGISKDELRGKRIALAVGSRGITNIQLIVKNTVSFLLSNGANPFIVPSMGSHGGATAAGQSKILEALGITEDCIGCPVISSMDTVQVGNTLEGSPVYVDKNAHQADGVILICRVKPHTDFRGPYESGIMKMMTVGLGKQKGADIFHGLDLVSLSKSLCESGKVILSKLNVICAVALIENASHGTCHLEVVLNKDIEKREPELLKIAKERMPQIYFPSCDVLIIEEIGKDISGTGMDPNITGRFSNPFVSGGIKARIAIVLDISEKSHGNAIGIGLSDITTKRVLGKIDFVSMYVNCLTAGNMTECKIPAFMETDEDAVKLAVRLCKDKGQETIEIIRIRNTLELDYIDVSEGLLEIAKQHPKVKIINNLSKMSFNEDGFLM
ncbi:lactate racemase domain-containing protein [Bacillota bacterium]